MDAHNNINEQKLTTFAGFFGNMNAQNEFTIELNTIYICWFLWKFALCHLNGTSYTHNAGDHLSEYRTDHSGSLEVPLTLGPPKKVGTN